MDPPPSSPSTPVLPSWQSTDYTVQMCVPVTVSMERESNSIRAESNSRGFCSNILRTHTDYQSAALMKIFNLRDPTVAQKSASSAKTRCAPCSP